MSSPISPSLSHPPFLATRHLKAMPSADSWGSSPASPIGFEGYEKRLEITFSDAPVFEDPCGRGLRALSREQIEPSWILHGAP